jgi:hypothetical protein
VFDLGNLQYKITLDSKDAKAQLNGISTSLKNFGDSATKTGKTLTTKLSLPIVALGGIALKMAADFEVSARKFAGAFKGSEEEASDSVKRLAENFGFATSEATKLLANTGDLLKGFGASSDEALRLAEDTQTLAAALSAYNGVSKERASESITTAILGERDALKSLGIFISEAAVAEELLRTKQSDLTGQALLLAKAEATLTIANKQSADAVNTFAENTGTASFKIASLIAESKDLAVEFGTELLPVFKDIVEQVRAVVGWFSDLDEGQKGLIISLAGIVAIAGPVIGAIGGMATALSFLAANPVVLALAGVAALTTAVVVLGEKAKADKVEELAETFSDLADETNISAEEMENFLLKAELVDGALMRGWGASMEEVAYQVGQLAINTGLTREQIVGIGLASENVTEATKDNLRVLDKQIQREKEIKLESEQMLQMKIDNLNNQREIKKQAELALSDAKDEAVEQAKITAEKLAQAKLDRVADVIDAKTKAQKDYAEAISQANARLFFGLSTEKEQLQESKVAAENYAEALVGIGYDASTAGEAGNEAIADMFVQIVQLESELKALDDQEKETLDSTLASRMRFEQDWLNSLASQSDDKLYLLEQEEKEAIASAEEIGASTLAIEEYYENERALLAEELKIANDERIADELEAERKLLEDKIALAGKYVGQVSQVFDNILQIQKNEIDAETQNNIDAIDRDLLTDQEYLDKVKEIEEEGALEKWKIEKKAYKTKQAFDIASVILNTAVAVMRGYSDLGPIGGSIAAAILIALGGTQIGIIKSQPVPPKPFADGGIVTGPVNSLIGEAGPEAVLPLNENTLGALGDAIAESTQGTVNNDGGNGMILNLIIQGMGEMTIPITQDALNNGQLLVSANALA